MAPFADRRFRLLLWSLLALLGWGGLLLLGRQLLSTTPPTAGFDLDLLLEAGRRVAAGQSPYDASLVAGSTVQAESLFYSYPPPVAQVMALVGSLPLGIVLAGWAIGATAGLALVANRLGRRIGRGLESGIRRDSGIGLDVDLLLPALAIAPYVFPFAVALLFGNLDAWFPLAYGAILLGVLSGTTGGWAGSGVVVGLIAVAKLHPASLGLWFLARGWRQRRAADHPLPPGWVAVGASVASVAVVVGLSLLVGGVGPWRDYLDVVRAGTGAELIDPRNIGPAAQIAGLVGGGTADAEQLARVLHVGVLVAALVATAWAALAREDPVESLAWASVASLVTLPVSWFHYPVALIPFAVAAWARARGTPNARPTTAFLGAALAASALSIALPVSLWVAVALVLVAVRRSGDHATPLDSVP